MIKDLENVTTAQEALEEAGLNWNVSVQPLKAEVLGVGNIIVPRHKVVVREGDNRILGVVGKNYHAASNAEVFSVADDVIAKVGGFYDRAMAFRDDSQVILQVKLPTTLTLGKDRVSRFLTFANSFDGSWALKAFITPLRIACQNMVAMAMERATDSVTIRHSSSIQARLNDVGHILQVTDGYHKRFDELAGALYSARFSDGQMRKLTQELMPSAVDENGKPEETTRTNNNRELVYRLFEGGRGHKETGITGTAWAAFNAVAEYVDHERSSRIKKGDDLQTKRLESAYFGSGGALKTRALNLIRTEVGV